MPTPNTSATGGYLVPVVQNLLFNQGGFGQLGFGIVAQYGAELDAIFQTMAWTMTGLDPTLVRPRWQPTVPIQPEAGTDWCSIGVTGIQEDDNPALTEVPNAAGDGYVTMFVRHESISVLASFYGPSGQRFAAFCRDGLKIPQNNDMLKQFNMGLIGVDRMRSAPDLVNQQWVRRYDLPFSIKRQVVRTYEILDIVSAQIQFSTGPAPVGYNEGGYNEGGYGGGPSGLNITTSVVPAL